MGTLRELGFFIFIALAQIRNTQTQDCTNGIISITSPSASSLLVQWTPILDATNYILDLRVVNMSNVAPVVVTISASTTLKEVFGLKPGTLYTVVLKVFRSYNLVCSDTKTARTVPDTSQINSARGISSTAITLQWDLVASADQYFITVNSSITNERYNLSFTNTTAVIQNLRPITSYDCYVFTSNSAGLGARSRVRTVTTLVPPPAVVTVVPISIQAIRVQWQAVDKVLLYKVTVTDSKGNLVLSTTVSSTFLDVQNVVPCKLQIISVSSVNMFLDAGEPKQVNYTSNTLGSVTSVSTDYSCVSASATISWGAVFGAESYRATALDQKGRNVSCTSSSTTCQLINLSCGKDYIVWVSAIANNCENGSSPTAFFQTVPCSPENLNLYRECSSNVIIFSWAPTNNTVFYRASMTDSTGGSQACITTDTSCFFTDTVCGRSYSFTVYGVNGECNAPNSPAVSIQTAPCKPSNLITVSDCKSDILMSFWDATDGVTQYIVEGRGNRGNASYVSYYSCTSYQSSCAIPGVACGESLTMTITGFNADCYSESVLGQETNTAPCVPQNLLPINDCSSDSITLTWSLANGALFYIASVADPLGGQYSCSTSNLNCQITGLRCGTTYNATVISSNSKCNSSASKVVTVDTAPCPPSQVQATLDCTGNRVLVSWLSSRFPGSYIATMLDQSGVQLNCSTVNSSCWISSPKCGQVNNISVTYNNNICRSKNSPIIRLNSIPCGPQNFASSLDCSSGVVQLTWDPTSGANGYTASVVASSSGKQMFCNSTLPNCSLSSLCGESYVAQVRSYNGTCFSFLSQTVNFKGVPCAPTNVTVMKTCTSNTTVTWQASRGAQSYNVIALSNKGQQSTCSSGTTTCNLINLQCGQVYSVSVVATDSSCSSIPSQSATLQTVPCAPLNIRSTIQCITNIVTLSWDASPGSVSYTGRAVGSDGSIVTCNSTSTGCQFTGLRCSQTYAIKLMGSDGTCVSAESDTYTQSTGPCAPVTVSNTINCDTNTLSVFWTLSPTALGYSALLTPINGLVRGCTSDTTSCVISGLQCGVSYSLIVLAANKVCTGPSSPNQIIQAAPCTPASVSANVACVSNTVTAAWAQAVGALSYTGTLTGQGGFIRSCSTSALSCDFSSLSCAKTYTFQVLANSNCNSSTSAIATATTGPCDPTNVSVQVQCGSSSVKVSWQASAGAISYTAQAFLQNQAVASDSCSSSSTNCLLAQLQCGTLYNVSVFATDGTCSSSPVGRTTVRTAPCPPVLQAVPSSCISDQTSVLWTSAPDVLDVTITATSVLGYIAACTSTNTNCTIQGLQCGQRYTLQGIARGLLCNSTPGVLPNINTAPCTPAALSVNYTCGTSNGVVSWNDSLGRDTFIARIQTQDQLDSCSTNLTRCSFSSLLCGRLYNVSVVAVAGQCNSSVIARTQIQTAPCAPQNVSVSLQCSNNTASVTWAPSLGAVGYNVTAIGRDGDVKSCRVSNTSCQIPNLHCSQTYNFVVTPFSDVCTGWPSSAFTFNAGPCPPTGVQTSLLCQNNVGTVSWIAAINAERYIALAVSTDGFRSNCTSNGTSCQFLDLYCGKNYSITVVSIQGTCWSDPSTSVLLRSVGCPPSNLNGVTNCATNNITVTWDPSPRLGVTYFLSSQQVNGTNSTFNTIATFITLGRLQCGVLLTVSVAAQDNNCLSQYSAPIQIRTAPCGPTGLVASTSCGTSLGSLTWLGGLGALFYTASLISDDGDFVFCTSNTNNCQVKLDCDNIYTVTVTSSTGLCNSTTNSSTQLISAPCLVSNITAQVNCTTNLLAVQWITVSANKTFKAQAISTDGTRFSCTTNTTSCTIPGLKCGSTYGIAVTSINSLCTVQATDLLIQTAPCKAENLSVSLECNTSIATVWWNSTGLDQSYSVSVVNFTGGVATCSTKASNCTFNQFQCGEAYTATVTGVTQKCTSQPSTSVDFSTAPCTPTYVKVKYDCASSITVVTWDIARGAENYIVYAVSSQGYRTNVSTPDTTCNLKDLSCGQDYSIRVIAERGGCRSLQSQPTNVSTGPCPQSGPRVLLDCSVNSAVVSWTPGIGLLYYNVSANAQDGNSYATCSTNGTSCNVTQLQCAQTYQVSVAGQGNICPSPAQGWVSTTSGPCPPKNVSAQVPCDSNILTISWQTSQGSVSYLAVAQSGTGQQVNCSSNGTTCNIPGLQCGQSYEVYVSGVVGTCIGPKSQSQIVKTAPCVPQSVQANLACQSTVLNVTWQQIGDATQFRGIVDTPSGQMAFLVTGRTFFTVPNILCGLTYNVTVVAQNDKCNSSRSSVQSAVAAPCPPQAISATINCTTNTISVNWTSSVVGVNYMVQAVSSNTYYTCNSTSSSSCSIRVPCGGTYNISVIPSQNGCTGVSSSSVTVQAAPCVPTLMSVDIDCLYNSAWVTWNTSAGAQSYTAVATDSDGRLFQCNSSTTICTISGLQCSRNYTFGLTATNARCSSGLSNTIQAETVPCAPTGVNVSVGCDLGTVSVQWLRSVGAIAYKATLQPTSDNTSCCTALNGSTSCDVTSLPCGQSYMVTVIAVGRTCNSSQSVALMVQTAPCQPLRPNATVGCTDNVANVTWINTMGGQLYTVSAVSVNGTATDSCSGFDGSCSLRGLACGLQYTVSVVAQHTSCRSLPSPTTLIKTVPCAPQNVKLTLDCNSRNLTVGWSKISGALVFTATLRNSLGYFTTCQSLTDQCTISGLACGTAYQTSVIASDTSCSSQSSANQVTDAIPCAPSNIRAQMDIQISTAVLSWYLGAGALRYRVSAVSSLAGTTVSCDTNQTNCNLINLLCGDKYNVTVQAVGSLCNNSASMGQFLQTGPCVPRLVSATYTPPVALLLWDTARGADNYTAQAVSQQGFQSSCSTRDTSCVLYRLNCSQIYSITLTAYSNLYQDGVKSNTLTLTTEPCPPNILTTRVVGDRGDVTWEPSVGAVRYTLVLEGRRGDTLYCQSSNTLCSVPGLQCGTVYVCRVTAIGLGGNSSSSVGALLTTVPCLPDPNSFVVAVQCTNNSVNVSWAWSDGATSYELTATNSNWDQLKCATVTNTCNITTLDCGQTYNLSLTAFNSAGSASLDTGISFQSRPCVPKYVAATLQCGTRTAVLSWEKKPGVLYFLGTATNPKVAAVTCNSTIDSCSLSGLQCGIQYSLSVRAYTRQCGSDVSASVNITTEPCQVQNLTVTGSCNNNSLQLNWSVATGALFYIISTVGNLAYSSSLLSQVPSLQVDVPCGQNYNFSVLGKNDQCYSLTSATAKYTTAPCVPTAVQTFIQCEDSIASVSWLNSDGALYYTAVAKGQTLGQTSNCTTNTTICSWSDLLCGEIYIVRVTASNLYCSSAPSDNTTIRMAPCIPKILSANFDCGVRVASITWQSSRGTQLYVMTADNNFSPLVGLTTNITTAQLSDLQCGQQYSINVASVGQGCRSKPSNSSVLQTEPCPPAAVSTSVDCLSNIVTVTWAISSTADNYIANVVGSDGSATTCMSLTTSCGIATLQCGQKYNASVTASRALCRSKPSVQTYLTTVACAPLSLNVNISCEDNTATLSWSPSNGSLWYYTTAVNAQGDKRQCNTTSTSCIITALQCGAVYNFSVYGSDGVCNSPRSPLVLKATAPCTPQSPNVLLSCVNNTAKPSWTSSSGSLWYSSSAINAQGDNRQCNTTGTTCTIVGLQCGSLYNFSVQGLDGVCSSPRSSVVRNATAPCAPQTLNVSVSCDNNTATLSWSSSSGSLLYYASAVNSQGDTRQCTTTGTSCTITGLQCGAFYNFSVQGSDGVCNSTSSPVVQKPTAPCTPQIQNVSLSCDNNTATLSWSSSSGSLSYSASAINAQGDNLQCNTTGTSCSIAGLQCGTIYNFSVQATNGVCNSSRSAVVQKATAPCAPPSPSVTVLCANNTATLSWTSSSGSLSYSTLAVNAQGDSRQCTTTGNSCIIAGLQCGAIYNFSVQGSDSVCRGARSPIVQKATAPCPPPSTNVSFSCGNNTATLSWSPSDGSLGYSALAVNAQGDSRQCNATGTSCIIAGLQCGTSYNFSVQGSDGVCNSTRGPVVQKITSPCAPQTLNVSVSCDNNTATLSWSSSSGSLLYYASAVNSLGDTRQCTTTGTSCTITGLQCGAFYNFSVQGSDGVCNSTSSPVVQKPTAPCTPQIQNVSLSCENNTATLSWSSSSGSLSYSASAINAQGDNRQCNTTGTSCSIAGLQCGTVYNFSVQATNGVCNSSRSAVVQKATAPCAPPTLSVSFSCANNTATLSWTSSSGSLSYYGLAVNAQGDTRQCTTTGTTCTIAGLQCGAFYNFSVQGSNAVCNSTSSPVVQKATAPCAPERLNVSLPCDNIATLSWSSSNGSSWYSALAVGTQGDSRQCNTTGTSCTIAGLQCGSVYVFSVQGSDGTCNSTSSMTVRKATVRCAPQSLNVSLVCENNTASLFWSTSDGAVSYFASVINAQGDNRQCNTVGTSCVIPGLQCGTVYNVSVQASDGVCNSSRSVLVQKATAPCASQLLNVSLSCANAATLSWTSSSGSLLYYPLAVNAQGDSRQCNTSGTSCTIAGLQCGTSYNFSVQGSDGVCNSVRSPVVQRDIAPCPPAVITNVTRQFGNDSLVSVSWTPVNCTANQFLVEFTGTFVNGDLAQLSSYWSERPYFEFFVPCGLSYTLVVTSRSGAITGVPSAPIYGSTGVCPLYSTTTTGLLLGRRRRDLLEAEILLGLNDEGVLPVPKVKAVHLEGLTLHVEWAPVTGADYYTLIVKEDPGSQPPEALTVHGEVSDVPDLKPATRYCVTVSAESAFHVTQSAYSAPVCVTTGIPIGNHKNLHA